MAETNTYDQLPYNSRAYVQTHPDHLAALARLHGLNPAPVDQARVLDIGTNEGGNILPMAIGLPNAQVTGIDLAETPIARGSAMARELSLTNLHLRQMDLMEMDASFGEFDYIIAHGLYAWIPLPVRDRLLAVIRAHLSSNGVAFVSYNTQPGGYMRRIMRDMMMFHGRDAKDPAERLAKAREILLLAADRQEEPEPGEYAIAFQATELLDDDDSILFHDYLAPVYEPAYFMDFAAHAARHGLNYIADASVLDTYNMRVSPKAMETVQAEANSGRVMQEQLLDFLRVRKFRQSLLCRAEFEPSPKWDPARAVGMYIGSSVQEAAEGEFVNSRGVRVTTNHADVIGYLRRLIGMWPRFAEIDKPYADMALELWRRGMVDLHTLQSAAVRAGERPVATPLIRHLAGRGEQELPTLHHRTLLPEDERGRKLLTLLDGSRTRDQLASEMSCSREILDRQLDALSSHAIFFA